MYRWHFAFRIFLASLIFSLLLALGLGSASAELYMSSGGSAAGHHADIGSSRISASSIDQTCEPATSADQSAGCCHDMIGGGCGGYGGIALSAAASPAISAWFVLAVWVALPAYSLDGLEPQANRRPPRLFI